MSFEYILETYPEGFGGPWDMDMLSQNCDLPLNFVLNHPNGINGVSWNYKKIKYIKNSDTETDHYFIQIDPNVNITTNDSEIYSRHAPFSYIIKNPTGYKKENKIIPWDMKILSSRSWNFKIIPIKNSRNY